MESTVARNCPNDDWIYNLESDDCVPQEGTVSITCNPTDMVIKFKQSHLFSDVTKIDSQFTVGCSVQAEKTIILSQYNNL